jgi:hypothetical protein
VNEALILTAPRQWPARMRRKLASEYLLSIHGIQLSLATLAKLAVIGGGPPFRLDGRFPLYDRDDLDAFATRRLGPLRNSTSDRPKAA